MSNKKLVIYTDGGARGNPGPAAIGVVIWDREKLHVLATISQYVQIKTNNQAEYLALKAGLEKAAELGAEEIEAYLDSELLVKQLKREYRVKDADLAVLYVKVWNLTMKFKEVKFHHVPRERNKEADKLVNEALDREKNR